MKRRDDGKSLSPVLWLIPGMLAATLALTPGCTPIEVPVTPCSLPGQRVICKCSNGDEGEQVCTEGGQLTVCDCSGPPGDASDTATHDVADTDVADTADSTPDTVLEVDGETDAVPTDLGTDQTVPDEGPDGGDAEVSGCGPTDSPCSDGDLCTITDTCRADGTCQGVPKTCISGGSTGTCSQTTGECVFGIPCASASECPALNCADVTCEEVCVATPAPNTVAKYVGEGCGFVKGVLSAGETDTWQGATLELWMRADVFKHSRILDGYTGGKGFRLQLLADGKIEWQSQSTLVLVSQAPLEQGKWHHVAGMVASGGTRLYINGKLVAEGNKPGILEVAEPDLGIGCAYSEAVPAATERFSGAIDDVRLSKTLRYNADFEPPLGPFVPDEQTHVLVDFEDDTFKDLSANKFNCSWTGAPIYETSGPYCSQ